MRAETLEAAASLLVLRRDTLWLLDAAGPDIQAPQSKSNGLEEASETEAEQPTLTPTGQLDQARSRRCESPPKSEVQEAVSQPTQSTKCTFSGRVPIDLKRFQESGVSLVECPDCASMRTLEPRGAVLRFRVSRQRQNDDSQYRTTMGQKRERGLGCGRRLKKGQRPLNFHRGRPRIRVKFSQKRDLRDRV